MIPFWNYIKKYKKLLIITLILAAINQIFSLLDPQIFRLLIDNYATKASELSQTEFMQGVILLLLAFIGVAFISRTAKTFQDYNVSVITKKVGTSMYSKGVEHTFELPYSVFEDRKSGEVLSKLQKARLDSQTLIENMIGVLFLSIVGMLFVITYAFFVNWLVGLVYLLLIPIIGISTFFLSRKIKDAQSAIVKESAELAGSTTETLRNVELVKSLGLEKQEIERLNKVNDKILGLDLAKIKLIRKLTFIQGTLLNALRAVLTLVMLWLIFQNGLTIGEYFTLFIYSFFIFTPLSNLGPIIAQYREAKASNEQLEEILNIKPEEIPENPVQIGAIKNIEYKDVYFTYDTNSLPSVNGINIKIKGGETVAFVGQSGSGKSTLLKLLVGLYKPKKGKVLLNNCDSKDLDYGEIRKKIGLVSQETQLFAGSIRENLLFINPNATDKECMEVLKAASVDYVLTRANEGLDTKIGEGGIKLSGGEKQRLAIARALLRNPELLIFDEATSSLDTLTEKEISETIKNIIKIKPDLIVILVAHRLSTVSHADKIYVLEKGKIIEEGNHNTLLKKKGLYYALWRQQISNGH